MLLHREEFLNVIQRAVVIAPADSPLESLECVLLEADHSTQKLTVTATNVELALEQRLPCKTDRDDALLVNARLLAAMLDRLDGDTVSLEHVFDGTTVTLRSGTASYTVAVYTRGGFPKPQLPFPEDTILLRGLPSMARNTVFAAAREKQQTMLSCVHLCFSDAGLQAVSSDGSCMVSARSAASCSGNRSLLLPAVSLQKLARMCREEDEFRVGTTGKSLVLFREDFLFSARLMEGGYINSDQLMQSVTHLFTVLTDVETLQETLLAVTTVHPNGKCYLSFQGTQLELRAAGKAGQAAMAVTVIPLSGMPKGDFWFSARRLLQSLRALSGTATLGMAQGGMNLREKLLALMAEVNREVAEREELIELIAIALLTRNNLFILGKPGQAKSHSINRFRQRITGARQFERLLSKQTDEDQLFGRIDLSSLIPGAVPESVLQDDAVYCQLREELDLAMQALAQTNDAAHGARVQLCTDRLEQYRRAVATLHANTPTVQTSGKIPEADIVFLDECFKANDGVLNSLLTALNERKYDNLVYDADVDVTGLCRRAEELFELYQTCANRRQVETICVNYIRSLEATKISINGHLFFVPRHTMGRVDVLEDFLAEINRLNRTQLPVLANSIYILDDARQREKMTEEFYAAVKKEIADYQERAGYLIQSGSQSPAVLERWVARIDALEEKKRHYETILRRELDGLDEEFSALQLLSQELAIRARGLRFQKAA